MNTDRTLAGVARDLDLRRRKILRRYLKGVSIRDCARLSGCSYETARKWVREAERIGYELALKPRTGPKLWPVEVKQQVVTEYLHGASPQDLMVKYALPHSNYPGMWAQKMPPESRPDHLQLARGAYQRAVDASIRHDEHWRAWVARMRSHFDQAISAASSEAEQLRLTRIQVDLMEKSSAFSSSGKSLTKTLGQVVTELKAIHPISVLLRAIGLPRSTYYWHVNAGPRPDPDEALKRRIHSAHARGYASYGYRRLQVLLRSGADGLPGEVVNHKKLRRLMHVLGIRGKSPTKNRYNSFQGQDPEGLNLLDRQFAPEAAGQVLVTDITMFTIGTRRLYFSPLIDLFNNQVVSWRTSSSPTAAMVTAMLVEELETFPLGSIQTVHTDQGIQYQSHAWKDALLDYEAQQSMSRVGNCHDNAPAESFFARVKTEFGRGEQFTSVSAFEWELAAYIQWWNEERIVQRLGTSSVRYLEQVAA